MATKFVTQQNYNRFVWSEPHTPPTPTILDKQSQIRMVSTYVKMSTLYTVTTVAEARKLAPPLGSWGSEPIDSYTRGHSPPPPATPCGRFLSLAYHPESAMDPLPSLLPLLPLLPAPLPLPLLPQEHTISKAIQAATAATTAAATRQKLDAAAVAAADLVFCFFRRKDSDPTPHDAIYDPKARARLRSALFEWMSCNATRSHRRRAETDFTHNQMHSAFDAVVRMAVAHNRRRRIDRRTHEQQLAAGSAWGDFSRSVWVARARQGGVPVPLISWATVLLAFDTLITLASLPYARVTAAGLTPLALCILRLQQNNNCFDQSNVYRITAADVREAVAAAAAAPAAASARITAATIATVSHRVLGVLDFTLPGSLDGIPLPPGYKEPGVLRAACAASYALNKMAREIGWPTATEEKEAGALGATADDAELNRTAIVAFIEQVLVSTSLQQLPSLSTETGQWSLTDEAYAACFAAPAVQCTGLQNRLLLNAAVRSSRGRVKMRAFGVSPSIAGDKRIVLPFEFKQQQPVVSQDDEGDGMLLTPPRKDSGSLLSERLLKRIPPLRLTKRMQTRAAAAAVVDGDGDGDSKMQPEVPIEGFSTPPPLTGRKRKDPPALLDQEARACKRHMPRMLVLSDTDSDLAVV